MKQILVLVLFTLISLNASAQKGDAIIGKWLNAGGQGQVEIYKKTNKYYGKIVWIKMPNDKNGKPLTDQRNLILSLRKRPILGLEILKGCVFNGTIYEDGTIYDPEGGKTYSCKIRLKGNTLKVSGYIGMFLGRTDTWTRVK